MYYRKATPLLTGITKMNRRKKERKKERKTERKIRKFREKFSSKRMAFGVSSICCQSTKKRRLLETSTKQNLIKFWSKCLNSLRKENQSNMNLFINQYNVT